VTNSTFDVGERTLPGWVLRAVVFGAGLGAVLAQAHGVALLFVLMVAVFTLVTAAFPASPAPALLIGVTAILAAYGGESPLRWPVLIAIPLLHLVHLAAALGAVVPVRARLAPRALLAPALRFLLVQAGVFVLVGLIALLPSEQNNVFVDTAGLLAVTAIAVLAIRLIRRVR
jgi:hypothetical protein